MGSANTAKTKRVPQRSPLHPSINSDRHCRSSSGKISPIGLILFVFVFWWLSVLGVVESELPILAGVFVFICMSPFPAFQLMTAANLGMYSTISWPIVDSSNVQGFLILRYMPWQSLTRYV